ncbi:hypothetical protein [Bradyrhizobium lablabi]|uniref:hypothetical protein n=1 Tax=Bradyrhizobium lablabi TaxID=722472 RepID=UPI001FD9096B|nr:hypothetical protein [Bradyrhizobium lablabi]
MHALFDGQVELTFGFFELALPAQEIGLGLLSLCKLGIIRLEELPELVRFRGFCLQVGRRGLTGLLALEGGNLAPLSSQPLRNLLFDLLTRLRELFALQTHVFKLARDFHVLAGELCLETLARLFNERSG